MDTSVLTKLTEAMEAVRTVTATAGGQEEDPASAVPTNSAAVKMAADARQSYQKTARWMLAAFAAVGLLIFGSLPFAAMADVRLTWPATAWLIGGLLLATAGIVSAVTAVSLVSEPEDASLGELDCDLRTVQETDDKGYVTVNNKPVIRVNRLAASWNPRLQSRIELANILHGPEATAHLGPNLDTDSRPPSVAKLINKLGKLETRHANLSPEVAKHTAAIEAYEKQVTALATLQKPESPIDPKYAEAVATLNTARTALLQEEQELAEVTDRLKLYHAHRDLVLAEAHVMQLRGTFRLARRILATAAVLTLLGGTAYALALPGATAEEQTATPQPAPAAPTPAYTTGLEATILVHEGTKPAEELPSDCVNRELPALWLGNTRIPPATGPFTALITDPQCQGQITVSQGEGRFELTR